MLLRSTLSLFVCAALFCAASVAAFAQSAARPEFEAASVKPSAPAGTNAHRVGCMGGPGTPDPSRFTCSYMALGNLVGIAYQLDYTQISAPDWLADQSLVFDVQATVPAGATPQQFSIMLQNLLADRFKLAVHRETRQVQHYELVVAKGGPKIKPTAKNDPEPPAGLSTLEKNGCPPLPGGTGLNIIKGMFVLHMPEWDMHVLSTQFAALLNTHVADNTGLTGGYDISLCWARENPGAPAAGPNGPANLDAGPTLQQAVQDQLGLRLESTKGAVEFLVVDHAEKTPLEN